MSNETRGVKALPRHYGRRTPGSSRKGRIQEVRFLSGLDIPICVRIGHGLTPNFRFSSGRWIWPFLGQILSGLANMASQRRKNRIWPPGDSQNEYSARNNMKLDDNKTNAIKSIRPPHLRWSSYPAFDKASMRL